MADIYEQTPDRKSYCGSGLVVNLRHRTDGIRRRAYLSPAKATPKAACPRTFSPLYFPKAILKERMAAPMVNGSGAMLNGHSTDQLHAGPSKPHIQLQPDVTGSRPGLHESASYEMDMDAFQLSILAPHAFY